MSAHYGVPIVMGLMHGLYYGVSLHAWRCMHVLEPLLEDINVSFGSAQYSIDRSRSSHLSFNSTIDAAKLVVYAVHNY